MRQDATSLDHSLPLPYRLAGGNGKDSTAGQPSDVTEITIRDLCLFYGSKQALHHIEMDIARNQVTAFIGPSGCGKSTLLRCVNRLNDLVDNVRVTGSIVVGGLEILDPSLDVTDLRKRVGMVFQKPNPFPKTIYENVAYGPRILGVRNKARLDEIVERSLKTKVEELIHELKQRYTIVIVTHNMQQAARVSDFTAFMYLGRLVEFGKTDKLFTTPEKQETEDYITGRFG